MPRVASGPSGTEASPAARSRTTSKARSPTLRCSVPAYLVATSHREQNLARVLTRVDMLVGGRCLVERVAGFDGGADGSRRDERPDVRRDIRNDARLLLDGAGAEGRAVHARAA